MCGITGIYSFNNNPITQTNVLRQTECIIHRGPDQAGVYLSPQKKCGLGIRRLSIIDVLGGKQPLSNEDDTIHLVYNGETYNHNALRLDLEKQGHQLKSGSDGEVILHGYEAWGIAGILQKIRGQAAFALWDEPQKQLFLARDRFGIKPLYYAKHNNRFIFASEIKGILSDTDFPREVNLIALQNMFRVGFVPGPETLFKGIYKLPPAHYLRIKDDKIITKAYWTLSYTEDTSLSLREASTQFLSLLQEAVNIRLMSEVPLGALLSGGLDSGTLVALMQANLAQPIKTVSIGFNQLVYDEANKAADLAKFIGTSHHPTAFEMASFDDYPSIMHHLEEPQCAATAVPIYKLYQACKAVGLSVVLTGEGADELLGGYHWHRGDALVRPLLNLPASLRSLIANAPVPMSRAARRVLKQGAKQIESRYQQWLETEDSIYRALLFSNDIYQATKGYQPQQILQYHNKLQNTPAPLHQTLWLETQTRMVDFINFEVDKMSMAHSVEARVPFLDHKLWEFCATLPAHYKLNGQTEKHLLRQATQHLLPPETRTRSKKGLAAPYAAWLSAKKLPPWAEAALSKQAIEHAGLFNSATVQNLREALQARQPYLAPLLMGVLSTQIWFDCFLGKHRESRNLGF